MACAPSKDSDQPGHPASLIMVFVGSLATNWVHSEDSDQTGRMPRLIRVFAGCTCHFFGFVVRWLIKFVLNSCYINKFKPQGNRFKFSVFFLSADKNGVGTHLNCLTEALLNGKSSLGFLRDVRNSNVKVYSACEMNSRCRIPQADSPAEKAITAGVEYLKQILQLRRLLQQV